jgi:hypothetical protein
MKKIAAQAAGHDESNGQTIMAAVEVLAVLCEQLHATPPAPSQVAAWRDDYLRAWESYIDALRPKAGYKEERRAVIIKTFDRLLAAAQKWQEG